MGEIYLLNEFFVQCLLLHPVVKMSKAKGKKPQRSGSNVFANFDQQQIQEFKEAFTIIDQDRDGFISEKDLKDMWASLGIVQDDKFCAEMTKVSPGQINFTAFLTFMERSLLIPTLKMSFATPSLASTCITLAPLTRKYSPTLSHSSETDSQKRRFPRCMR